MKLLPIRSIILAIVFATLPSQEIAAESSHCERRVISLKLESLTKDFAVTGSWMSVEDDGTVLGEVLLRNQTGKALSLLTVVVNYLDENGSILFSIPYQANLPNEKNELRNIHPFSTVHLNEPVRSGEGVVLTGRSLLCITSLPASAEVVYWLAKSYGDGASVSSQIGRHGSRTDPVLVETPGNLQLTLHRPSERVETLMKLMIDQNGRVLEIQPGREEEHHLNREQFEALTKQLSQWQFFPSIENGYAVQSQLFLLVEFEPEHALPVNRCFSKLPAEGVSKFVLVTLQPILGTPNEWIPYYAGFPAAGKMEANVIDAGPVVDSIQK